MDWKKHFTSPVLKWIFLGIVEVIVLLLVFRLGVTIGYRKANFSYRWGENYRRVFGGPAPGTFGLFFRTSDGFMNPHGTSGTVVKVENNTIVMKGSDNVEKTIVVGNNTTIRQSNQLLQLASLKSGDQIVVLGQPDNQGQIDALFIRVFNQ